ncbi:MAG: sugar phosphate nucleotidyltransferase [Elusimicrobiaceae bacterium]|nr:sugar phosphate nucleotidyltransferase [Elusimicrobiaceae bacterium]
MPQQTTIAAVILAGGYGTRLWPLSRRNRPKQFIRFDGELSLFGNTLARAAALTDRITVVTALELKQLTSAELQGENGVQVLLEPVGRQTAPSAGLAALSYLIAGSDPILLIMPADHHIRNTRDFTAAMRNAVALAERENALVCAGKKAVSPETGFGYLRAEPGGRITRFVEKPPRTQAEEFVKTGQYRWNTGIFAVRASVLLDEIKTRLPEVYSVLEKIKTASRASLLNTEAVARMFGKMPAVSIDAGLMQHNPRAFAVEAQFDWNDVGSWQGVYEISAKDRAGNAALGDVRHNGCTDCLLISESGLLAAQGLAGMALIQTADATLACPLSQTQAVREITRELAEQNRPELDFPSDGAAHD